MDATEFKTWFDKHTSAFASLRDWLRRNADCVSSWQECLSDVALSDAIEATRLMNIGDLEAPKGYGDHARSVRKHARELAYRRAEPARQREPQFVGDERVYQCADCCDTGWVMVANIWVSKTGKSPIKQFLEGKTNHLPVCAIACTCDLSNPSEKNRFDSTRMFAIDRAIESERNAAEFRQWWSEGRQHGNRVAAFDAWNEGATA